MSLLPAQIDEAAGGIRAVAARRVDQRSRRPRPTLVIGLGLLLALLIFVICVPLFLSPYQIYADGLDAKGFPLPFGSSSHPLGTDTIGRDMLARLAAGGRTTLEMTILANVTSVGLGVLVGLVAGFFRGVVEQIFMRLTDVFLSIPTVMSGLALASVVGTGVLGIVVVVTALYWAWTSRMIYGEVLRLRSRLFVDAAVAAGVGKWTILRRHILPHLYSLILLIAALNAAAVVSIGAGLSFLGAGIQPPQPDWGNMLQAGQNDLQFSPHLLIEPLVMIVATVFAFMLIADGLTRRDPSSTGKTWLDE